jgi:lysophospholipase L1-like esterase
VIRLGTDTVYPLLAPWDLAYGHRTVEIAGRGGLPLAGLPNVPTGLCTTGGSELVFESDANGLRNAVDQTDSVRIAVIGDSFAQGYCVTETQSISGILRSRFGSVTNLAATGAGPLWELGLFREYAHLRHPRMTVWLFYEGNDLEGADVERSGFTGRYLDAGYTQHLASRQADVDTALTLRLDSLAVSYRPSIKERLRRLLLLREIRARLALSIRPPEARLEDTGTSVHDALPVLKQVLSLARTEASTWGGEVLFVYLPERSRFASPMKEMPEPARPGHQAEHPGVVAVASSLGIEVVDMVPVFAAHPSPLGLFDEGGVHYNARGYALVADSVAAALSKMDVKPSKNISGAPIDRWVKARQLSLY